MAAYIVRRLLGLVPILIGVSLFIFFMMRMLPGDVASMILGGEEGGSAASREAVEALRLQLGLDEPYWQQYVEWIGGLMVLDGGNSLWSGRPVMQEIGQKLPLTIQLALMAFVFSIIVAIPIGIISAVKRDTWVDMVFRSVSVAGLAIPAFWLGTLTILFLTLWFDWIPPLGYVPIWVDWRANFSQLIWPALILGFGNAAILSRMTRSAMLEVMGEDYIRTAWAKGLSARQVLGVHALRNAILPVITLAGIELGHLLSGAVVMETIFNRPGLGRYLIDAIFSRDYPVVQTVVLLLGVFFVTLNLLVDLVYGLVDPRIRFE